MAKTNFIQTDFLAGEISPRIELQSSLEGRKHGVELMQNWFPRLQGSAETVPGTKFVASTNATEGVIFGFPVALMTSFAVVITGGYVRIFDSFGPVQDGNVVQNEYFTERGLNWTLAPSTAAPVMLPGAAILSGGRLPTLNSYLSQTTTVVIGTSYTLAIDIAEGEGPIFVEAGIAGGDRSLLDTTVYGPGRVVFPGLISSTTEIWIRIGVSVGDPDVTLTGVHLYDPTVGELTFVSLWGSRSELSSLQAHMIPGELAMLFTSADHAPYKLELASDAWSFGVLPRTGTPASWGGDNWPPAAGFFGGRLWLGGLPSDPSKIWGSKTTDYGDFTLGSLPGDALEFNLSRSGAICWIAGGPGLLVGTSNAEHVISSEGGVITPSDQYSQVQSTNGSYPAQALEVGNEVMYISPDGRKIRSIGFEWLKDAWRSRDITYASEHITEGERGVTRLQYSANPHGKIWALTEAEDLTVATYEPYTQTTGFSRRDTQGKIISIASIPFNGSDELWMLVYRGGDSLFIEKEVASYNTKLDSYVHLHSTTPISGGTVPHLAEKECQVLVDGAVHPNVTPDISGVFETEYAGNDIYIGLQIYSVLRTLPIADEIADIGTTRPMNKRFTEVQVRVVNSWPPKVNGRRAPSRSPGTPMGEIEPPRTTNIAIAVEGWSQDAQVLIEQDLPLRSEIAGWFGRVLQEEI